MLWRSRRVLRTRTHDVFRRCGQDAQNQQGCDELWSGFEYERKHRRDGDCDENGDREAVILSEVRAHKVPHSTTRDLSARPLGPPGQIYCLVSWELGKLLPTPSVR